MRVWSTTCIAVVISRQPPIDYVWRRISRQLYLLLGWRRERPVGRRGSMCAGSVTASHSPGCDWDAAMRCVWSAGDAVDGFLSCDSRGPSQVRRRLRSGSIFVIVRWLSRLVVGEERLGSASRRLLSEGLCESLLWNAFVLCSSKSLLLADVLG